MSFSTNFKVFVLDNFYKYIYTHFNPNNMIGINLEIKTQLDNLDKSVKDIVQNQNTKTILQKARFFVQKFIQQINKNNI